MRWKDIEKISGKIPAGRRKIIHALKDFSRLPEVIPLLEKGRNLQVEAATNPSQEEARQAEEELDQLLLDLSKQHNLPVTAIQVLMWFEDDLSEDSSTFFMADVCEMEAPVTKLLSRSKKNYPPSEEANMRNFPVQIKISSHAFQEEVISYIKKNWENIEAYQKIAHKEKIKGRTRLNEELDDLVWKTFDMKPREALQEINNILVKRGRSKVTQWRIYDRRKRIKERQKKLGG